MNQFINNDYQSLADFLFSFSGNEFAIVGSIIGFILCQNLNANQMNSLGNFFELIGQFMLSVGSQEQLLEANRQANRYK